MCTSRTILTSKYRCRTASSDYFIRKKKKNNQPAAQSLIILPVTGNCASRWALWDSALNAGAHLCDPMLTSRQTEASSGQANWDTDRVALGIAALDTCSKHLQTYSPSFTLFLKFESLLTTHFCMEHHYLGERNYRVKYKAAQSIRTTPGFGAVFGTSRTQKVEGPKRDHNKCLISNNILQIKNM